MSKMVQLEVNKIYTLKGNILRLLKQHEFTYKFQNLNKDLSDFVEYNYNSEGNQTSIKDHGIRITQNIEGIELYKNQ
jgi:hypothetical protein